MFGKKNKDAKGFEDFTGRFELCPSLQSLADESGLVGWKVTAALRIDEATDELALDDRHTIFLFDGETPAEWKVDSLRTLFRGDEAAPPASELERYPREFVKMFYEIERNLPLFADGLKFPPTDGEMEEVFKTMRRRPDGKSLGQLHDFVWQNAAVMLGKYRCSEALYTALMKRLEHSARTFKMGMSSRNFMDYLCSNF